MFKITFIALWHQLLGWERRDTIEGGLVMGGDVYCIDLWKPTKADKQAWEKEYRTLSRYGVPCFACANRKTLRYKLNDYIHSIKL